jgi:hypothetical protein
MFIFKQGQGVEQEVKIDRYIYMDMLKEHLIGQSTFLAMKNGASSKIRSQDTKRMRPKRCYWKNVLILS